MTADLPSDDEEDEDFNPTGAELEGRPKTAARGKRGLPELSDDDDADASPGDGLHATIASKLADAMDDVRYAQPPPGISSGDEGGSPRRRGEML